MAARPPPPGPPAQSDVLPPLTWNVPSPASAAAVTYSEPPDPPPAWLAPVAPLALIRPFTISVPPTSRRMAPPPAPPQLPPYAPPPLPRAVGASASARP